MTQEAQQGPAKTILLVEDDDSIRGLLTSVITSETDYQVLPMSSDAEVFQRLDEVRAIKPVLLLLDYRLPTMTGLGVYDHLHALEELKDIPALIITAYQLNEDIEARLRERDIAKLEKPFDLEDFLSYIEQTIRMNQISVADIRAIVPERKD